MRFVSGDLATLDPVLLSPGEMLCLTDAPDPAYQMSFRTDQETRAGNFVSAKVIPGSAVKQNDILLVIGFNREPDPSHVLVVAQDHLGWIVLEHLRKLP